MPKRFTYKFTFSANWFQLMSIDFNGAENVNFCVYRFSKYVFIKTDFKTKQIKNCKIIEEKVVLLSKDYMNRTSQNGEIRTQFFTLIRWVQCRVPLWLRTSVICLIIQKLDKTKFKKSIFSYRNIYFNDIIVLFNVNLL